jgi:hypothetical protein
MTEKIDYSNVELQGFGSRPAGPNFVADPTESHNDGLDGIWQVWSDRVAAESGLVQPTRMQKVSLWLRRAVRAS